MQECRVYDKAMLEKINPFYSKERGRNIEQSDVQIINRCISIMYDGLNSDTPKVGDIVEYFNKEGEYFPYTHIDRIEDGIASVYILPFISCELVNNDEVEFESFDGGLCVKIPLTELKNRRAESMNYYFFTSSDRGINKGIVFKGYANRWTYHEVSTTENISLKDLLREILVRGLHIVSRFIKCI